jgi:hypothetical protein
MWPRVGALARRTMALPTFRCEVSAAEMDQLTATLVRQLQLASEDALALPAAYVCARAPRDARPRTLTDTRAQRAHAGQHGRGVAHAARRRGCGTRRRDAAGHGPLRRTAWRGPQSLAHARTVGAGERRSGLPRRRHAGQGCTAGRLGRRVQPSGSVRALSRYVHWWVLRTCGSTRLRGACTPPAVDPAGQTPQQRRLVEHTLQRFRRLGAALVPATRTAYQALRQRISALEVAFQQCVNEDVTAVRFAPEALAGCAPTFVAGLARDPIDGRCVVPLKPPQVLEVLQFAEQAATRRALLEARDGRCAQANMERLLQVLHLRQEAAELAGFPSHAAFRLANNMAATPAAAEQLLCVCLRAPHDSHLTWG